MKEKLNGRSREILPELHAVTSKPNPFDKNLSVFDGCSFCKHSDLPCKHKHTRLGPSTGAIISELQKMDFVKEINVYGMNWNGGNWHNDFKHKNMVPECCSKCTIHETKSNKY